MPIEIKNTRESNSYVGTFNLEDPVEVKEIENIRAIVKHLNKDLKQNGYFYRFYVKLQGRGYRQGVRRYNQSLPLSLSKKVDAYIYKR